MRQETVAIEKVPLDLIRTERRAWPRHGLDQARVAEFFSLYGEGEASVLPPLDLVPLPDGLYLLADGHHRFEALLQLWAAAGKSAGQVAPWALARVLELPEGREPLEFAFELGVETAARVSKPLTRAERRAAVLRLLAERPGVSDRELARMVGVSHQTVGRLRRWSTDQSTADEVRDAADDYYAFVSAEELAVRLARSLDRLWQGRALSDLLLGDRMGRRLAEALVSLHGEEDALRWARRLKGWASAALVDLENRKD